MDWLRAALLRILLLKRRWIGLLVGLAVWFVWVWLGFWHTVLLIVLAGVGYGIGRVLEERQNWKKMIEKILSEHYPE
ncbi:DUF2273 domain-containing protein [Alicyclobacillaceae bacterium I2511]|nr:DUF2273 domain-containing protein [Alicyclobacillaceae bacterium I2511]